MFPKEIKILIIENNMEDVQLILETLRKANLGKVRTQYANTLSVGLKWLKREKFDIVILELALPDCVGFEPIKKLKNSFPDIPIIVLTGFDEELKAKALRLGVHTYLNKHKTDPEILLQTINSTIA